MKNKAFYLVVSLALFSLTSCKKEKIYTYGVDDVDVSQPGVVKSNLKTDLEFISIAYTDLFGTTIPQDELEDMALCYVSFGDKRLMIDLIIQNLLNEPGVQIPSQAVMDADPEKFVTDCYRKFFVREPSQFENWWLKNRITTDPDATPEIIYYSFLTSNEYRYY